tara:strand:+ start:3031 stop:3915 length:885 start_codon:yes stop_codon:yes gene_type:complete
MSVKKRGLGRGLEALLSTSKAQEDQYPIEAVSVEEHKQSVLHQLPIHALQRGAYQPRKDMSESLLQDLSASIKAQGLIQPIVVRSISDGKYEIIAGERRWRACQMLNMKKVSCVIKEMNNETAMAIALIENIQREDLNVMEQATALLRLVNECKMTHQEVAQAVGKSRSAISNLLRLNQLHRDVKVLLEHGDLEMGHARALLALESVQQIQVARMVVAKDMTVRETEKYVQKCSQKQELKPEIQADPDILKMQDVLSEQLGTKVMVQHMKGGRGKLVINYDNLEHLDGILTRFN